MSPSVSVLDVEKLLIAKFKLAIATAMSMQNGAKTGITFAWIVAKALGVHSQAWPQSRILPDELFDESAKYQTTASKKYKC